MRRGLHVSEYGVLDDAIGRTRTCASEAELYELLGLAYIEPELRENRGELEAARLDGGAGLPSLVSLEDIRGDLHSHTVASDGHNTIEEMAGAARERGYEYLAITDHSATHGFGNDVSPEQLRRQIELVREANARMDGHRAAGGQRGERPARRLARLRGRAAGELDWVIASVHTAFGMSEQAMTERMIAAIEHPLVDAIGHPTGRLIERREPYAIDLEAVFAAAARTRNDARDQRQPRPARPLRRARARRGPRGRAHPDRLRRPPHRHTREHALGGGHRAPRVAVPRRTSSTRDRGPSLQKLRKQTRQ